MLDPRMMQAPPKNPPNSHAGMADEILRLFSQGNLQIPVAAAERFVEIKSWLSAISDGELVLSNRGAEDAPND